ncbi:MAG: cytochrome P460 family protein [Desulfohalobiaceae bacterium]
MEKYVLAGISLLLVATLAFGPAMAGEQTKPAPEAKALWKWITEKNPYQGWGYWPGHRGMYRGRSPHGAYIKFYANSIALKAARMGKTELPPGSILMKANYAKDEETLVALTPMYKVEGYNPEAGDWFWAKYSPEGKVQATGKVESCIDCHRSRKNNDWIFTPKE